MATRRIPAMLALTSLRKATLGICALFFCVFAVAATRTATVAAGRLLNGVPGPPYEKISKAIKGLPDFIPTMGEVYVNPKDLPDGPYLGYSRDGKLLDTVYMIPIKEFDAHAKIPEPHYHIVLWHVPRSEESLAAK